MSTPVFAVLRRIADGDFHSGAALANAIGVSRATVWNAVRHIEAAGLTVYKVPGRGYKLAEPLSLLDACATAFHAGAHARRFAIEVTDDVASTNTLLMERAARGAPSGTVIAAEWQRQGRGRLGRVWHAGLGRALTFSVLWRFARGAAGLAGLSLAVGVALVRALDALGVRDVRLKWPNDVTHERHKLAGILVELQGDALGPSTAVIGIGINVRLDDALKRRIDQPCVDLESLCGCSIDRNRVLGVALACLAEVLDEFDDAGFASLREEWQRRHAHQGKTVFIKLPTGRVEEGVALGLTEDGALLFRTDSAIRRLHSGEISLREPPRPRAPSSQTRVRSRA